MSDARPAPTPERVVAVLRAGRFPLSQEKETQAAVAAALDRAGIDAEREARLAPGDVVDLMVRGGTAIEVKIKGSKRAIHAQCRRYCAHESVKALVLLTGVATGFPSEIEGKPCYVVALGRAWL